MRSGIPHRSYDGPTQLVPIWTPEKPRPPTVAGLLQMWTGHCMAVDPKYLRQHARRCWTLAAGTGNPVLKKSLVKVAQRSVRLAVGLEQVDYSHHQAKMVLSLIKQDILFPPLKQLLNIVV